MDDKIYVFNFFEYINENFFGLILFISVFFIIYFIDYINRLNAIIFSTHNTLPIPGAISGPISGPITTIPIRQNLKKKFKKR